MARSRHIVPIFNPALKNQNAIQSKTIKAPKYVVQPNAIIRCPLSADHSLSDLRFPPTTQTPSNILLQSLHVASRELMLRQSPWPCTSYVHLPYSTSSNFSPWTKSGMSSSAPSAPAFNSVGALPPWICSANFLKASKFSAPN